MSQKDDYTQKLQTKLDEWDAEIDRLKARAAEAEAEGRIEYNRQIEDLRTKREEAEKKIEELRQAGEGAWEDLKAGVEKAWDVLGETVNSAISRFK